VCFEYKLAEKDKFRDVAQVEIKDEVVPMEGPLAIHNDKFKDLEPGHESSKKNRRVSSFVFEWEVEITDPVLQATNPM